VWDGQERVGSSQRNREMYISAVSVGIAYSVPSLSKSVFL